MKINITLVLFTFIGIISISHSQNSTIYYKNLDYNNFIYPYGTMPDNIGQNDIEDAHISWKNSFVNLQSGQPEYFINTTPKA